MKYISAYALCVLGGNTNPSVEDVANVLRSVGADIEQDKLNLTVDSLKGKQLHELIEAGTKKMATLSVGAGNAQSAQNVKTVETKAVAEPEKKPDVEKTNEPEVDMSIGLFGDEDN